MFSVFFNIIIALSILKIEHWGFVIEPKSADFALGIEKETGLNSHTLMKYKTIIKIFKNN